MNWRMTVRNAARRDSVMAASRDYRNIIERLQVSISHNFLHYMLSICVYEQLQICFQVQFMVLALTFKALDSLGPGNLRDCLLLCNPLVGEGCLTGANAYGGGKCLGKKHGPLSSGTNLMELPLNGTVPSLEDFQQGPKTVSFQISLLS